MHLCRHAFFCIWYGLYMRVWEFRRYEYVLRTLWYTSRANSYVERRVKHVRYNQLLAFMGESFCSTCYLRCGYGALSVYIWMDGSNGFVPTITEKVSAQQIWTFTRTFIDISEFGSGVIGITHGMIVGIFWGSSSEFNNFSIFFFN